MKKCNNCKSLKTLDNFHKNKYEKDGFNYECKLCKTERNKIYYKNNQEKIKQKTKEREFKTGYCKEWRKKNKNYSNEYIYKRKKEDFIFKFSYNVRCLIKESFKRGTNQYKKSSKSETILGCTIVEFRNYIKSKFTEGMTIENHGEWHLDHIKPLASATTEEEIIKLNHYTNFQPLWAIDNLKKGSKI